MPAIGASTTGVLTWTLPSVRPSSVVPVETMRPIVRARRADPKSGSGFLLLLGGCLRLHRLGDRTGPGDGRGGVAGAQREVLQLGRLEHVDQAEGLLRTGAELGRQLLQRARLEEELD